MEVAAHLDRPVAGVGDDELELRETDVQLDDAVGGDDFSGDHWVEIVDSGLWMKGDGGERS
jgi:hypothetical protein